MLDHERIFANLIGLAAENLPPDEVIQNTLKFIGEELHADRAYIFEINNRGDFDNTYEWCADGVEPQIENLQNIAFEICEPWVESFHRSGSIVIRDLEEYREIDEPMYEVLKPQDINTLIACPIEINGEVMGFVGIDNPPPDRMDKFVGALKSLGFMMSIMLRDRNYINEIDRRHTKLNRELGDVIQAMTGNFIDLYYVNMVTDMYDYFRRDEESGILVRDESSGNDFFADLTKHVRNVVVEDELIRTLEAFKKKNIQKRLQGNDFYSMVTRVTKDGKIYFIELRFAKSPTEGDKKLIVGVYNVDREVRNHMRLDIELTRAQEREHELRERANELTSAAYRDKITGLYNRTAFEEDCMEYENIADFGSMVLFCFDLNGLKMVNDTLGHMAGDEMLKGASGILHKVLSPFGKVYRYVGAQFCAVLFLDNSTPAEIISLLKKETDSWTGERVKSISLAVGFVERRDAIGMTLGEMMAVADKRMYESKALAYAEQGIERRRNQEVFELLEHTYSKIFKVNLDTDMSKAIRFKRLDMADDYENIAEPGASFVSQLKSFAENGLISDEDKKKLLDFADLDFLCTQMDNILVPLTLTCHTKDGSRFVLEIVRMKSYSPENREVFVTLKMG